MSEIERHVLRRLSADYARRIRMRKLCTKYGLREKQAIEHLLRGYRNGILPKHQMERLLIKRKEVRFPTNAEDRLAAVLASMNNGLKQALFLVADIFPRTYTELHHRLSSAGNAHLPSPQVVDSYFVDTFTPSGLSVIEWYGQRMGYRVRNFRLSSAGIKYGQPIAAFSLKYAVTRGISLYELLGQRQSVGGTIGPYNRVRILEILSCGQLKISDLARRAGLVIEDVRQHLRKMSRLRLLAYDSVCRESKGIGAYSWVDGRHPAEARQVGELSTLTRNVAKWLYLNKQGERNQIANAINYHHVTSISSVLVGLAKQGLVRTPFIPSGRSRVLLLERSRLILDYAKALRDALAGGIALREMKGVLREFMLDRYTFGRYVDACIEIHHQESPQLNARKFAERELELLGFIRDSQQARDGGIQPVDAARLLNWTPGTVTRCLRSLLEKRQLRKTRRGTTALYTTV